MGMFDKLIEDDSLFSSTVKLEQNNRNYIGISFEADESAEPEKGDVSESAPKKVEPEQEQDNKNEEKDEGSAGGEGEVEKNDNEEPSNSFGDEEEKTGSENDNNNIENKNELSNVNKRLKLIELIELLLNSIKKSIDNLNDVPINNRKLITDDLLDLTDDINKIKETIYISSDEESLFRYNLCLERYKKIISLLK